MKELKNKMKQIKRPYVTIDLAELSEEALQMHDSGNQALVLKGKLNEKIEIPVFVSIDTFDLFRLLKEYNHKKYDVGAGSIVTNQNEIDRILNSLGDNNESEKTR